MGSKREDVDLELVLKNPKSARHWIDEFNSRLTQPLTCLAIDRGNELERIIQFSTMTDEEAVEVAWHILHDFEIRREEAALRIARDLNEIH